MKFNDSLRIAMDEAGDSVQTLAKKVGCYESTIYNILRTDKLGKEMYESLHRIYPNKLARRRKLRNARALGRRSQREKILNEISPAKEQPTSASHDDVQFMKLLTKIGWARAENLIAKVR